MSLHLISEDSRGKRKIEIPLEAKCVNMFDLDPRDDINHTIPIVKMTAESKETNDQMRLQPKGESKSI